MSLFSKWSKYYNSNSKKYNVYKYNTIQYNTIQYNAIRVYCENTLSYINGVLLQTEPKSGSVKARQLIYRYSTNTHTHGKKKIRS